MGEDFRLVIVIAAFLALLFALMTPNTVTVEAPVFVPAPAAR
jgi:hypothetical protein